MKNGMVLGILVVMLALAWNTAIAQTYDPLCFSVCPEHTCYVACPAGDLSFGFCINYLGEPLLVDKSQVFMTIQCTVGCIYTCALECLDKCAYLSYPACVNVPGCGSGYNWAYRIGGCCTQASISLHMLNDPTPFYQATVAVKTPDFDCDGKVGQKDQNALNSAMGSSTSCYDLNCDGIVNTADLTIFLAHKNHNCDQIIGTEDRSWGAIKSMYTD
jgi:hypothetical protein